jgi:hypothetical protein
VVRTDVRSLQWSAGGELGAEDVSILGIYHMLGNKRRRPGCAQVSWQLELRVCHCLHRIVKDVNSSEKHCLPVRVG